MFIFRWLFGWLGKFFSSKAGKITAGVMGAVGAGAAVAGGVEIGKAVKLNRRARKMRDEALQKHEEHYSKVQAVLEATTKTKMTAIASFDEFADQMAMLQGRPEFNEIGCKGVELPAFTAEELKVISNKVALAVEGAAYAGAGAGLGIAAYGLNVLALGPGLLIGGIGMLVAGGHIKKKAIENSKQAKQLVKDVDEIIKQYDELAAAATMLGDHIGSIYAQYSKRLTRMKKILAKKTVWSELNEKEQLTIENTILLVGMLYKLCKIELIVKVKKAEKVNAEEVKGIEAEIEAALRHTKSRGLFA